MKTRNFLVLIGLLLGSSFGYQAYSEETQAEYEFSQAELDQILAPIALYPDTILSHILIAATYPLEVIQAERWASENPSLEGDAALKAVEGKDWDPSVKALVAFPNILKKMSEDLDWMQKLGDAFLQNEELVLASVQELRQRAYEEGNLDDLEHLSVSHEDDNIVIESNTKEIVYVPYYDTRVVYGPWWWVDYPPAYWAPYHRPYYSGVSFYWGPRIYVGTGIYFSSCHWNNRRVVVVDRHYAHRHNYYSGRHVVRNADARHWEHNTRHRRGVEYRHPRMQTQHISSHVRTPHQARQVADRLHNANPRSTYNSDRQNDARISGNNNAKWNRVNNQERNDAARSGNNVTRNHVPGNTASGNTVRSTDTNQARHNNAADSSTSQRLQRVAPPRQEATPQRVESSRQTAPPQQIYRHNPETRTYETEASSRTQRDTKSYRDSGSDRSDSSRFRSSNERSSSSNRATSSNRSSQNSSRSKYDRR